MLAVTGEASFALRHRLLFDAIASGGFTIVDATTARRTVVQRLELAAVEAAFAVRRILRGASSVPRNRRAVRALRRAFLLSATSFVTKSRQTARNVRRLTTRPDIVMHIFSLYGPRGIESDMSYVHYLDFTIALRRRNWPPDYPPLTNSEYRRWIELEGESYRRAAHIFVMSALVQRSLVEDYAVDARRVTVVGSGGRFPEVYDGERRFGSRQLLFNARPFALKGGEVVLEAFARVRRIVPDVSLVVVGETIGATMPGLTNPGFIADADRMRALFLESDLVLAPSRTDAFPGFVIEAMGHGVPCVVSPCDGLPEIVDDGIDGVVLARADAEHLARAIIALLGDEARLHSMSQAARQKIRARFSWPAIGARIGAGLREIVRPSTISAAASSVTRDRA
ncbi:MAG: hypothetical protein NVS3B17_21820 [Vulcanimicrobiaceae bacterium]